MFITNPSEELLSYRAQSNPPLSAWPRTDTSSTFYQVFVLPAEGSDAEPTIISLWHPCLLRDYVKKCTEYKRHRIQKIIVNIPPGFGNGDSWISEELLETVGTFDSRGILVAADNVTSTGLYSDFYGVAEYDVFQRILYMDGYTL